MCGEREGLCMVRWEVKCGSLTLSLSSFAVLPTASVLPPSQVVHLNQSANLTCEATGRPTPQLSWLHEGVPIEGSSPGVTVTPTDLFITMVTGEDAGVYTCSADNDVGRAIAMATITILCEYFDPLSVHV